MFGGVRFGAVDPSPTLTNSRGARAGAVSAAELEWREPDLCAERAGEGALDDSERSRIGVLSTRATRGRNRSSIGGDYVDLAEEWAISNTQKLPSKMRRHEKLAIKIAPRPTENL